MRKTTMTIVKSLCIKGIQWAGCCSKCGLLWIISEEQLKRQLAIIGLSPNNKGIAPRYRSSSK